MCSVMTTTNAQQIRVITGSAAMFQSMVIVTMATLAQKRTLAAIVVAVERLSFVTMTIPVRKMTVTNSPVAHIPPRTGFLARMNPPAPLLIHVWDCSA